MVYILVCFLTLFTASRVDLMYENITGVARLPEYHMWTMIFTVLCALFFAWKMHKIFRYLSTSQKQYHWMINITAVIMCMGSFFPYTMNGHDLFSKLHVYCSMIPSLLFLILLFIYYRLLSYEYPLIYTQLHWYYDLGLQFLGILLVVFTRVNGYLEILFAFLVCFSLYSIEKAMEKEKNSYSFKES